MTYDLVERSRQGAQRVDLVTVDLPNRTFHLTSLDENYVFDGETYLAITISSSSVPLVAMGGSPREVTISLALDHELALALREGGVPPQNALVTIRRTHVGDSGSRLWWRGYIASTSTDNEFTRIRVPNKIDLTLDCLIPVKLAERRCPHVLGDVGCGVDLVAGGFRITPTVAAVDGTAIVISSIGGKPDHWARDGKVVRVSDGEERSIVSQVDTALEIDFPFRELAPGDSLYLFAGCDHSLLQAHGCKTKFNNVRRFGGEPNLPTDNPASPLGLGVAKEI